MADGAFQCFRIGLGHIGAVDAERLHAPGQQAFPVAAHALAVNRLGEWAFRDVVDELVLDDATRWYIAVSGPLRWTLPNPPVYLQGEQGVRVFLYVFIIILQRVLQSALEIEIEM